MPTLVLPTALADSDTVGALELNNFFYNDAAPTDAFNIVNGYLDGGNFGGSIQIGPELTQRGTHVNGSAVAGTANLDFMADHYGNNTEEGTAYTSKPAMAMPIPGGSMAFHLAQNRVVRFSWTVFWTNDNTNDDLRSRVVFYVNGDDVDSQVRQVGRCQVSGGPSAGAQALHYGYRKNRAWSGHHQRLLGPGWHSASLRLQCDGDIPQTRVWARHLDRLDFSL